MFNFDPNDPRQAGLMQMALALMANKNGNLGQAVGQAGMQGLMGYQQAQAAGDRRTQESQERDARGLMLQQQRQQLADQDAVRGVYSRNAMPGNLVSGDDEGNPMPAAPQGLNLEGLRTGLMSAGSAGMREAAAIQGLMQKQQPKYHVVGGALVPEPAQPGQQSQPAYQAPQKTPDWLDPRYVEVQTAISRARRPEINVHTSMPPLEKREQGDKGALNVKNFGDLQLTAGSARKENALLTYLEKNPIDTSKAAPITTTAAAWLAAAGLGGDQVKNVAKNAQTFNAVAMDLVLQKQIAQKGPQTESDARRLEQTVASLGNTREANAAIISFSKALNNRTISQEKFFGEWWRKHRTFEGADIAWINGEGGKSLWDDPALTKFAKAPARGSRVIDFNDLP